MWFGRFQLPRSTHSHNLCVRISCVFYFFCYFKLTSAYCDALIQTYARPHQDIQTEVFFLLILVSSNLFLSAYYKGGILFARLEITFRQIGIPKQNKNLELVNEKNSQKISYDTAFNHFDTQTHV